MICIGKATKLAEILTADEKEYIAEATLGVKTDTLDNTGNVIEEKSVTVTKQQIIDVLNSMIGNYNQEVPIYSAVKIDGKKLYEYARNNISVELPKRNVEIKKIELVDDVKYIDNSNLCMLNRSKLTVGDMLFTYVGTVGQVALIDKNDKYYLAPNVALIRISDERFLPKFMMYYFLTQKFRFEQIDKLLQNSSMQNLPMGKIRKFKLPALCLNDQQSIVDTLDRFDKLCNDISEGLPAEIEARQKQYEYYRDNLLSFREIV